MTAVVNAQPAIQKNVAILRDAVDRRPHVLAFQMKPEHKCRCEKLVQTQNKAVS